MNAERSEGPDDEDHTVVAHRDAPASEGLEPGDDATVVVPRSDAPVTDGTLVARGMSGPSRSTSSPLAEYMRTASRTAGAERGFDPERRIAEVPERMPWEAVPVAEAGLHPGLPVVYGPRARDERGSRIATDEVTRRVGPPPADAPVEVRTGRAALPSIARRERRRRTLTLFAHGAVMIAAALGLWGVAVLTFGS